MMGRMTNPKRAERRLRRGDESMSLVERATVRSATRAHR
jgi:hypothetical protein